MGAIIRIGQEGHQLGAGTLQHCCCCCLGLSGYMHEGGC